MVQTGLDRLLADPSSLEGLKVGLVSNIAAVSRTLQWSVDALREAGVDLRVLFAPEHGLYGAGADATAMPTEWDERRNLWVHSLYGPQDKPNATQLKELDLLLYDIPDIGARFYTYIWTMSLVMEACAEHGLPLMILDRPNPISGFAVEGPGVQEAFQTFEGRRSIPIRHGWTNGELAQWHNRSLTRPADLHVHWCEGWSRDQWFDETGLPWVSPSPAMATLETATIYPGTCLFEGVLLSEGRGTSHPFEWIGAPWVDEQRVAARLNELALPGVYFRPTRFIPFNDRLANQLCHGIQVHVTERRVYKPVKTGICVLAALLAEGGENFHWTRRDQHFWVDCLWGDDSLRHQLTRSSDPLRTAQEWDTSASPEHRQRWRDFCHPGYPVTSV
jgi:uncharacterized protein YbbC (DUF1343 family)